jgi:signal transduction histidine kinase
MSQPVATIATAKNAWERWQPVVHRIFSLLLMMALVLSQTETTTPSVTRLTILFLSAALFVWYFIAVRIGQQIQLKPPLWQVVYFVIGWLLWYVLANLNSFYFFLLFILFPYVFMIAPMPWSIVLMVILNGLVLITLNRISSDMAASWMIIVGLTSVGAGLLGYFVKDIIHQSEERGHLIAELQATRENLAQTQHEAGVLSERQRLAGELHDTIAQGLIGIITQVEAAENAATQNINNTAGVPHHLEQAKIIARSSLQETRRFIWAMHSVVVEGRAFYDGLRHILESWSKASNLPTNLVITGLEYSLLPEYEFTILRIIQESLANIARHARASHATVTLSYTSDAILLDINDDGCGFDPGDTQGRGFGLINMRYRTTQLGGTLAVESEAGEGTTITAHLPVKAAK